MTKTKVTILGTTYTVLFGTPKELPQLEQGNAVGITCPSKQEIQIDNRGYVNEVESTYRHEILHAFFYECGLVQYYQDETLVEFIATQYPKLQALFSVCITNKTKRRLKNDKIRLYAKVQKCY